MDKCWCGNTKLKPFSEYYYKCDHCETLVCKNEFGDAIYKIKDEAQDLYGENYWKEKMLHLSEVDNIEELIDMYMKGRCLHWLQYILKYVLPDKDILEIGCGLGQLSYLMKILGYKQNALELSPHVCKFVKEHMHINIQCGDISTFKGEVDCIIAMDVFEHLLNPCEFLKEVSAHFKEEGILCLQTPCFNPRYNTFDEMKSLNPQFLKLMEEKEHIFLFSKKAMNDILKKEGFIFISYEPAFFGEDYDMFLFASRKPFTINTQESICARILQSPYAYLYRALFGFFNDKARINAYLENLERDHEQRLKLIKKLDFELKEEKEASVERLALIKKLTDDLDTSEKDRQARLEIINKQEQHIQEIEADRQARLDIINKQQEMIQKIEADRQARLDIINKQQIIIDKIKNYPDVSK